MIFKGHCVICGNSLSGGYTEFSFGEACLPCGYEYKNRLFGGSIKGLTFANDGKTIIDMKDIKRITIKEQT